MLGWLWMSLLVVHEGTATSAASPCVVVVGNGGRHGTSGGHESKSSYCGIHPRQKWTWTSACRCFWVSRTLEGGTVHGCVCR